MDSIGLYGIKVYGKHGYTPEERVIGQTMEVDIAVGGTFGEAGASDHLGDTIDYGELYRIAEKVVGGGSQHLLETIATDIAREVLRLPGADEVTVRVSKPNPPVGGQCDLASVEITRSKAELGGGSSV